MDRKKCVYIFLSTSTMVDERLTQHVLMSCGRRFKILTKYIEYVYRVILQGIMAITDLNFDRISLN